MRPTRLIPPQERLRLEAAIAEAERGTCGELALVVVRACDPYDAVPWRLAVALAAVALLAVALAWPEAPATALLSAQGLALVAGHALAELPAVRRSLVSDALRETRVAERARRAFAEHGLARTPGRCGILLFVTLLERRVVVLADEGVHGRVAAAGEEPVWQALVAGMEAGLREGRAAEALLATVQRCGALLAAHAPGPERPADPLPHTVVLEDGAS